MKDRDIIELLFRLGSMRHQEKELEALRHSHGIQEHMLRVLIASSEQTLAVMRLTKVVAFLTLVLIVIGAVQICIMLFK